MARQILAAVSANRPTAISAGLAAVSAALGFGFIGLAPPFIAALLLVFGLTAWGIYRIRTRHLDSRPERAPFRTVLSSAITAALVVFIVAQAVPYGRDHSNPPMTGEPAWATTETRELVVRACFDCHSNEVNWPWYSNVAPFSWATWQHVKEGRDAVNYSEWDRPQDEADESLKEVKRGSMPPAYYTAFGLHSDGKLTQEELTALLDGLARTPGLSE